MDVQEKLTDLKELRAALNKEKTSRKRENQELTGKIQTLQSNKETLEAKLLNTLELGSALDERMPEAKKYQKRLEQIEKETLESNDKIKSNDARLKEITSIMDEKIILINYLEYYQSRQPLESLIFDALEKKQDPQLLEGVKRFKKDYQRSRKGGEGGFEILINRLARGADFSRK